MVRMYLSGWMLEGGDLEVGLGAEVSKVACLPRSSPPPG